MISLVTAQSHPIIKLWRHYEAQLERRPVLTQAATTAVLWGAGDVLAQRLSSFKKNDQKLDLRRTALTAAYGGSVMGPLGHFWYSHLDTLAMMFASPGTKAFLWAKVLADATVWNAIYTTLFFMYGELVIERGTWKSCQAKLRQDFAPTYLAEALMWPPFMFNIFDKLPVKAHLLAVNMITVLDVAFLAVIRAGGFNLPWVEQQQQPSVDAAPAAAASATKQASSNCKARSSSSSRDSNGSSSSSRARVERERERHLRLWTQHDPQQQQQQQPTMLMPALASMHSSNTSGCTAAAKRAAARNSSSSNSDAATAHDAVDSTSSCSSSGAMPKACAGSSSSQPTPPAASSYV